MQKKVLILILLLLVGNFSIWAIDQNPVKPTPNKDSLTRTQVLEATGLSFAGFWGADLSSFIPAQYGTLQQTSKMLFLNLEGAPLWAFDSSEGATMSTVMNASEAESYLLQANGLGSSDLGQQVSNDLSDNFHYFGLHTALWSTYQTYADARERSDDPAYLTHPFHRAHLSDLLAAPFNPSQLLKWQTDAVLLPLTAIHVAAFIPEMPFYNGQNSVFSTGKAYIGNTQVPIYALVGYAALYTAALILPTAIGEEALTRGTEYEEWKVSLGVVPARLVEAATFAAYHIPGDLTANGFTSPVLLGTAFVGRYLMALWFQNGYDDGGLAESVFDHFWLDALGIFSNYLLSSGVPQSYYSTASGASVIQINFSIPL